MSGVIKADAAGRTIRRFAPVAPSPAVLSPKPDEEKKALLGKVEDLKLALVEADKARAEAERRARSEGRTEGREAAEAADAERLAAIGAAAAEMTEAWRLRLESLEGLAAAIAHAALSKLFDSWEGASEFVTRTIARQVRTMRRETVAAIRVSRDDFPDDEAVAGLAARASTGSVNLIVDPDLSSGECRADLQLGHLDLGLASQRAEIAKLLESLGDGAETPA